MKALRNPVALTAAVLLQACSSFQSSQPETTLASLSNPSSIKPQSFVIRGDVILGHEARSITPCGSHQQYWLDMPEDKFQQAMKLVRSPYAPIYGEMIGHLKAPDSKGFAANYGARFVVEQINLLTAENPKRCNQSTQPTKAFGNEPFWSAKFIQNSVQFEQMGYPAEQLDLQSSKLQHDRRRYTFSNGNLELNQQSCKDTMSDSLYGWRATLNLGDRNYQGCATLSNQDTSLNWVATYQAKSSKGTPFSVTLKLNSDHTASTTYSYQDGSENTVEKGFWQQLNKEQIQVVSTHLQGQSLRSERIYTKETPNQLRASKEKVGTLVYDIADGGLKLYKIEKQPAKHSLAESNKVFSSAEFEPMVDEALRTYFASSNQDPSGTRYRWLTYDLNNDGQKELLVQLDWCGSGGCTLLIFNNINTMWQFNSRITLVQTPLNLGTQSHGDWRDLVMFVSGGGAIPNQHTLKFDGNKYPLNPSNAPIANYDEISPIQLFADGLTPHQGGITL